MADDTLTITIDEAGRVLVESRTALRRLAARPGRYRLVPSATQLIILEKVQEEGEALMRSSFGPHYERLLALKRQYDPTNFFRLNQNIDPAGGG